MAYKVILSQFITRSDYDFVCNREGEALGSVGTASAAVLSAIAVAVALRAGRRLAPRGAEL